MSKSKKDKDVLPPSVGDEEDEYTYYSDDDDEPASDEDEVIDKNEIVSYDLQPKPGQIKTPKRKAVKGVINKNVVGRDSQMNDRQRKSAYSEVNLNKQIDPLAEKLDNDVRKQKPKPKLREKYPVDMNYYAFNNLPPGFYNQYEPAANMYGYAKNVQQNNQQTNKCQKHWYQNPIYVVGTIIMLMCVILLGVTLYLHYRNRKLVKFDESRDEQKEAADAKYAEMKKAYEQNQQLSDNMFKGSKLQNVNVSKDNKDIPTAYVKNNSVIGGKITSNGRMRDAKGRFVKMNK